MIVPGTGVHLNNMLGEQDLNPLGFHRFPPGRRLPSMMAPTIVLRDGAPELVLGSAGSNRIRSAILQTIIRVVDRGPARRRGGEGAARPLRGRGRLRRARHRRRGAGGGRADDRPLPRAQPLLRRCPGRASAIRTASSGAAVTPGVAATRSWCNQPCEEIDPARHITAALALVLAGCGLEIQEPDLFLLTRTGEGKTLTMLVNDSGTISCNGGKMKMLADPLLIQARDLAQNLDERRHGQAQHPPYAEQRLLLHDQAGRRNDPVSRHRRRAPPVTRPGRAVHRPDRAAGMRPFRIGAFPVRKHSCKGGPP